MSFKSSLILGLGIVTSSWVQAGVLDAAGSEALARKSGCFKCHAIDKKKDGPPYRELAGKFRGKADAESKLFDRLSKGTTVKIDGKEEEHEPIKTKDADEIRSVVKWILSF